ncbi:retrovirus-related pol polyprotein from transposon TNT 1-94 [Tanacetum coccineum]|uniref:Retrovirus-related pol polyprotein from transposon TNT 1-94 n=1 Tax=Tanacetum coccineum TaxID=301880 RepID=A0ABQ5DT12_9ASTR
MVPRAVLMKSGLVLINTARQNISKTAVSVNTARQVNIAHTKTTVNDARSMSHLSKTAHPTVKRPINKNTTFKDSNFNQRVNTVRDKNINVVRPKAVVNTARPKAVVNVVQGNNVNVVKALACWVWKPKIKGNPQQDLQEKGVIDSGFSRHMTGNMSYLTDFEEIDGGYVAFGGNPKGRKITGKDQRVKVIRCDNATKFKNKEMKQFCERKGIKREFSVARTPQQNGVAERKNRTLIEAAKTMLADSKLPTTFWAEAVNTACYVCHVIILNTINHLGEFDGKADKGFFIGYPIHSKAFRVFNSRTRIVVENLHVQFSENTPNIARSGPNWLFDIDALTKSMNYKPVFVGNQSNGNAGTKACDDTANPPFSQSSKNSQDNGSKPLSDDEKKVDEDPRKDSESIDQEKHDNVNSTNNVNAASTNEVNDVGRKISIELLDDPNDPFMPELEDIVYSNDDEGVGAEVDMNNLDASMPVWTLVDLPNGKRAIGTKWVYRNKKDARGIVIKNKERLVAQGYTQEERIEYDEVFALIARIEAIRLFLAYASFKYFVVYQMDVKSAFLYGKIEYEVYVCQPPGFEDPDFPNRVYKVEKALYRLHQAPRAWYETLSTYLLENRF